MDEQPRENNTETVPAVPANNSNVPDEQNLELIEAFIGDNGDTMVFYEKAFTKYHINGVEKFAFCFSWGGFVFGALNLFHRKLYLAGVLWIIGSAILSGISSGLLAIVLFFAGAFVNPFLVYKRFKKLLAECNAQNMTHERKIMTLKASGGTNTLTTILMGIIWIIVSILIVIGVIVWLLWGFLNIF
jgi:hypothetical protein